MTEMPENQDRYAPVVNDQYNDEDESHMPLLDEGHLFPPEEE